MRKILLIVFLWSSALFLSNALVFADEGFTPNNTESESVSRKMDKVIQNQEEILKQLAELKAEVQIVKIRASSR